MRFALLFATVVGISTLCACAGRNDDRGYRLIPAPADAIAVSASGDGMLALVGGNDSDRNVTLESASDGTVIRRFGVTREADSIAVGRDGRIYLGLTTVAGGAIEEWSAQGRKLRVIPAPAAVVALASSPAGTWAFVRDRAALVAFEIPSSGARLSRSVPLPAGTTSLAYCEGMGEPSLIVSERDEHVTLVRIRDAATTDTTNVGRAPVCSKPSAAIYALTRAGGASYLSVIAMQTLLAVKQTPTMHDAVALATDPGGDLIVLGKGPRATAIGIYARAARDLQVRV
ncbi:MAG: hypothetical protein JO359_00830 [Candidatus Eremiobacteraeota bacterium]|nr:hypothetical protein [Candidatus Eremiobacteraeota bacterium]